ncbi:MAG: radical SAM protein [Ruminococcus sp.]|uniref:elongator complex protein 3 n=1 Tax=Ruminococcus sp. TaxID=41978 RepID=UPI0025DA43D3|nr:radical SAM protein [Ruminococcus sp.]MBR6995246.1 radical SAM protein [Ruminococcus sp.]
MKHSNISVFVPHVGCPHKCSFCDQRTISGAQSLPRGRDVREVCEQALREVRSPGNTEIAFFGGSFTAIPRDYMLELLEAAKEYVGEGKFMGIRCSTRPDCISAEVLELLKGFGVTAIELGAQSMKDEVLEANERGHTAQDVVNAGRLIREHGFELGLQMMTGLYKSSLEDDMDTARRIADLAPDTVRIYPVAVLRGTRLGQLYLSGEYAPVPFDEMVEVCADIMKLFTDRGIRVIKCGLHASEFVEQDMVAGYYHPAFRELCEAAIYRSIILDAIEKELPDCRGKVTAEVSSRCISKAVGQKRANIEFFRERGLDVTIVGSETVPIYECKLRR